MGRKPIQKKMTFDQAVAHIFENDLKKRGVHHGLQISPDTLSSYRRRYKLGTLSYTTKRWLLNKCGYEIIQEELWQ
jgi:hypothetical protein